MEVLTVKGESRSNLGSSHSRSLRREGKIPCVLYGVNDNIPFIISPKSVKDLVYSSEFKLVDLQLDGQSHKCIIREVQFHPISESILHIDFLKLQEGRKVQVEVPVRFTGTSPGEKQGGKLMQKVRRIKIKTTPEHLLHEVVMDVSEVSLGQSLRVRDIEIDDNIEIMNNPGIPLASVEVPRALKAADEDEEEGMEEVEEGAEGAEATGESES